MSSTRPQFPDAHVAVPDDVWNLDPLAVKELAPGFADDRCVFVTGVEVGGLAYLTALLFGKLGRARVIVHSMPGKLESNLALLRQQGVERVDGFEADFNNLDQTARLLEQLTAATTDQPLDTFCGIAGVTEYSPFTEMKRQDVDRLRRINVESHELLLQGLIEGMAERGFGRVCLFSSIHAFVHIPGDLAYKQTKAMLAVTAQFLAGHYSKHGVLVNSVFPGWCKVARHFRKDDHAAMMRDTPFIPTGKTVTPTEVACLVEYLCSRRNGSITGHCLPIDGGQSWAHAVPTPITEQ